MGGCYDRPMIDELIELETNGIVIERNGVKSTVKVIVGLVTGDNLFLNSLFGFVESFTARYPCRTCLTRRQTCFTDKNVTLRTKENYDAAVEQSEPENTGVKQACILNQLKYFHCCINQCQDIMHDLYQGICAYDMSLIINWMISSQKLDLNTLNDRLQFFPYTYHDICNKPPIILEGHLKNEVFPMEASQVKCLTQVLSMAVGDLIEEGNEQWQVYLSLRDVMDILLSPYILEGEIARLKCLVREYFERRTTAFPNSTLKPKHHFLTHYGRLIEIFGPLCRYACFRGESKHQKAKKRLHISGNYKNVPLSLAKRHQSDVAFRLMKSKKHELDFSCGPTTLCISANDISNQTQLNSTLKQAGIVFPLLHCEWVEVKGTKYVSGCFLASALSAETEMPVFVCLSEIFVDESDQQVMFFCELLRTVVFNIHYHSWIVEKYSCPKFTCCSPSSLLYYLPLMSRCLTSSAFDCYTSGTLHLLSARHRL